MANLDTISEYNKFIDENTLVDNRFLTGYFYTYYYDYRQDYMSFSKVPKRIRDFYDGRPLVFIYEKYITKSGKRMARGVNLHYLPMRARVVFLSLFRKLTEHSMNAETRVSIPNEVLLKLFRKIPFAVKQYNINKINKLRKVPFSKIYEASKYTPPSHEGMSYEEIANEYRIFNPNN